MTRTGSASSPGDGMNSGRTCVAGSASGSTLSESVVRGSETGSTDLASGSATAAAAAAKVAARMAAARAALALAALDRAAPVFATDSDFAAAVRAAVARTDVVRADVVRAAVMGGEASVGASAVGDVPSESDSGAATGLFGAGLGAGFGLVLAAGFFGRGAPGVPSLASAAAFARAVLGRPAATRGVAFVRGGALGTGALRTGTVRTTAGVVACVSAESSAEEGTFCSSGSDVGGAGVTSLTYQGPSDIAGFGGHPETQSGAAQSRAPGSRKQHGKESALPPNRGRRVLSSWHDGVSIRELTSEP